jgi:hypothetical protein
MNQRSYSKKKKRRKEEKKKLGTGRGQIDLVIVEDLECVIQDRLDDTDLPPSIGDAATGVRAHEGWSIARISGSVSDNTPVLIGCGVCEDIPKANG